MHLKIAVGFVELEQIGMETVGDGCGDKAFGRAFETHGADGEEVLARALALCRATRTPTGIPGLFKKAKTFNNLQKW